MKRKQSTDNNIYDTDRMGELSEDWPLLRDVMVAVADEVASKLFPITQPTLLVQPGLLARFRLSKFITRMVEAAPSQTAACFLLVPGSEQSGVPVINGQLPLAELSPSDAIGCPHLDLEPKASDRGNTVTKPLAVSDEKSFAEVVEMIQAARGRALTAVNASMIDLYWRVGEYISRKLRPPFGVMMSWGVGRVHPAAASQSEGLHPTKSL